MFCTIATFNLTAVNFLLFNRAGLLSPSAVMLKVTINYYIFLVIPMGTSPKIVNFSCPRLLLKYIFFWYICHFKPNCSTFLAFVHRVGLLSPAAVGLKVTSFLF